MSKINLPEGFHKYIIILYIDTNIDNTTDIIIKMY